MFRQQNQNKTSCHFGPLDFTAKNNIFLQSLGKLVVATGFNETYNQSQTVEVIDIENMNNSCDNLADFPEPTHDAQAAQLENGQMPFICGGTWTSNCYFLNDSKVQSSMKKRISTGNGLWYDDKFYIIGGEDFSFIYGLSTLDNLNIHIYEVDPFSAKEINRNSRNKGKFPEALTSYCLASDDEGNMMAIGGAISELYVSNSFKL